MGLAIFYKSGTALKSVLELFLQFFEFTINLLYLCAKFKH